MIIEKKDLMEGIQLCINSYKGEHGKVVKIFEREYNFKRDHIEWQLGIKGDTLYVVFQGSQGLEDWIDNFKFLQVNFLHYKSVHKKIAPYFYLEYSKDVRVHEGFAEQYYSVQGDIFEFLDELIKQFPNISNIKMIGHSLGGALALLCWNDFKDQQKWNNKYTDKQLSCMYFGAPRVGNYYFIEELKSKGSNCVDVIFRDDLVPRLPLWILGYRRYGYRVHLTKKRPWWKSILFSYRHITGNVFDHYPEKSKCAIEQLPEQISV